MRQLNIGERSTILYDGKGVALATLSTLEFAQKYFGCSAGVANILLPAVRWISKNETTYLIERSPEERLIKFYNHGPDKKSSTEHIANEYYFKIKTPWLYYLLTFPSGAHLSPPDVRIGCRPEQLYTPSDPIYHWPMPNINRSGQVCNPPESYAGYTNLRSRTPDISRLINFCLNEFWENEFNTDMGSLLVFGDNPLVKELDPDYKYLTTLQILEYYESASFEKILTLPWNNQNTISWTLEELMTIDIAFPADVKADLSTFFYKVKSS